MMNSFTEQTEQKEDKTKQILNLDHAMVVEEIEYEFPPIELLQVPANKKQLAKNINRHSNKIAKNII